MNPIDDQPTKRVFPGALWTNWPNPALKGAYEDGEVPPTATLAECQWAVQKVQESLRWVSRARDKESLDVEQAKALRAVGPVLLKALAHRWVERPDKELKAKIAGLRADIDGLNPAAAYKAVLLEHIERAQVLKAEGRLPSLALAREQALLRTQALQPPAIDAPTPARAVMQPEAVQVGE